MATEPEIEKSIGAIEHHCLNHNGAVYELAFPEGDTYRCKFDNGEYEDNEEEVGSPSYEEWYVLDFKVVEIVKDGPNKDPRFEYVTVSRKHMPSLVECCGEVVYRA